MKRILSIAFLVLFSAAMLVSCDDDLSSNNEVAATESPQELTKEVPSVTLTQDEMILLEELSSGTPKISQEQAMEIANNFLNKGANATTLSKHCVTMPRCEVLTRAKQHISKSGSATEVVDTILYVFNYNEGYAVVSADVRVPEQILAYSDDGYFSLDTDNPGIQIFIEMAQDYIGHSIERSEMKRDSLENQLEEKLFASSGISINTSTGLSKAKRVTSKKLVYSNIPSKHESTEIVGPYSKTYWHQGYPYNAYAPMMGEKQCPAGCVAVAFSQLMAFYQWPFAYNRSAIIHWNLMLESPPDKEYIAWFIHKTGTSINTKYDTSGSSASTENAIKLLRSYGYQTNNPIAYSFEDVKQSIDNRHPVIIDGCRWDAEDNEMVGHCWIIDGYAKETWSYSGENRYVIMYKDDVTGEISGELQVEPVNGLSVIYYQHFNLGWSSQSAARGYYLSNVFDVTREYRPDSSDNNKLIRYSNKYDDRDYKYNVRIATNIYH